MDVNYSKAQKNAVYCQEVYQDFSSIKLSGISEKPVLISNTKTDTQCAILTEGSDITIVFRGSESSYDWNTNLNTKQEQKEFNEKIIKDGIVAGPAQDQIYPYPGESSSGAMMHQGFVTAYFSVKDDIHAFFKNHTIANVTVTGHSLGGALATLCAVDLQYNFGTQISRLEVYTYGSPKVGNDGFQKSYNRRVVNSYRFVHGMDIVPEVPRWWQGNYRHVDQEFRIGKRLSWHFLSDRFKNHAIAQYIDALKALAK